MNKNSIFVKKSVFISFLRECVATCCLWLPILLMVFLIPYNFFNIKGLVIDCCTALFIYLFVRLFKKGCLQTILYTLLSFAFLCVSVADLVLIRLYGQKPSVDDCYVVFQTNADNSFDYLQSISSWYTFIILIFCFLFFWCSIRFFHRYRRLTFKPLLPLGNIIIWTLLFASVLPIFHKLRMHSTPFIFYYSYNEFRDYKKTMQGVYSNPLGGDFKDVYNLDTDSVTCVVIVGESQGRHRMQLYGYDRLNTPLLAARKDIFVFDSVVSPYATTSASLSRVFTQANSDNPNAILKGSIMQLANKAGFETYYLSNQKAIGLSANMVTVLANGCKHVFFNKNAQQTDYQNTAVDHYDSDLLPELHKALKAPGVKKMIFLHVMGCHAKYTSRYPDSFEFFNGKVSTPFHHKDIYHAINTYDNAMLYSDWLVNKVIEELIPFKNKNTSLLWFSDHGEEVYESIFLQGHSSNNVTQAMLDIPLIIWSNNLQLHKQFDSSSSILRPQCSDDLFYTFCDLIGVRYSKFDATRSVVNNSYLKRPLVVLGNKLYNKVGLE